MPRIRTLKPEAFQHRKVGALSDRSFRLWVGCLSLADDDGRLIGDAAQLRVLIFGYHESVTAAHVDAALGDLAAVGLIGLYTVADIRYIHFPSWRDHQRIHKHHYTASHFPAPTPENNGASPVRVRERSRTGTVPVPDRSRTRTVPVRERSRTSTAGSGSGSRNKERKNSDARARAGRGRGKGITRSTRGPARSVLPRDSTGGENGGRDWDAALARIEPTARGPLAGTVAALMSSIGARHDRAAEFVPRESLTERMP